MPRFIDLTGKVFDRLTVIKRLPPKAGKTLWFCLCSCGKEHQSVGGNLRNGHTRSCGCLQSETLANLKHGMHKTPEYKAWQRIKKSCFNKNSHDYKYYGGRGLTMYEPWINSFELFFSHVGLKPTPKHSIDRINNSLGYIPNNVRWATATEQNNNKRSNIILTVNDEAKPLAEWSSISGIQKATIKSRLKKGFSHELAIFAPLDHRNRKRL